MKLCAIQIKKFRHMKDLDIQIGERLTIISGQNGTGKSTILGLIGQVFDFKGIERTKNNKRFATKFSEIFKFCPKYDINNTHEYEAILNDSGKEIIKEAKSRFAPGEGKNGRFRIDIGERFEKGKGAINHPVFYLGLKRLFPLAQEREGSIAVRDLNLNGSEQSFYNKYAKDILILLDRTIKPQDIKTPTKEFYAMETKNYGNLGNSAGQDSVGQILTTILSFKSLKETLGDDYKGGILLVDELDATLYAGSQVNLLKRLFKFSCDYNLQIIFTTHSLEMLKLLNDKKEWKSEINFLEVLDNKVKNKINPKFEEVRDKILVQTRRQTEIKKIHVLCEDEVTERWCKNLLNGTTMKNKVHINKVPIGAGTLKELEKKKHIVFRKMLFVLDGDQREQIKNNSRIVFLPGKSYPEKIFYGFLYSLNEEDDYWDNDNFFTKQVCFNEFIDPGHYKNWYNEKCGCKGNTHSRLLNKWKKINNQAHKVFQKDFKTTLDKIIS